MDFEERIERGEDSEKWCGAKAKEELPLWVADMDFACSDAVIRALQKRVDERIYGYTTGMSEAYKACVRASIIPSAGRSRPITAAVSQIH